MPTTIRQQRDDNKYRQTSPTLTTYADLTSHFLPHPSTGQVTRVTDVDSVKQSIRNIVLTDKYERVRRPRIGANIRRHLFDMFDDLTMTRIESDVETAIENNEPRARVLNVKASGDPDTNSVAVTVTFSVLSTADEQSLTIPVYRAR